MENSKKDVGKTPRRMMTFAEHALWTSLGLHEKSAKQEVPRQNADLNERITQVILDKLVVSKPEFR